MSNRLLDIAAAGVLLLMTGPLFLAIVLAIRWESPGRVFDRHPCTNRQGRLYEALTFRTSEYDAARGRWARKVTHVGWFLLYTRTVSLPQLINVLRGDMTLFEMRDYSSFFWE
jgi:polysaccharide biosynthesis protein PslA